MERTLELVKDTAQEIINTLEGADATKVSLRINELDVKLNDLDISVITDGLQLVIEELKE